MRLEVRPGRFWSPTTRVPGLIAGAKEKGSETLGFLIVWLPGRTRPKRTQGASGLRDLPLPPSQTRLAGRREGRGSARRGTRQARGRKPEPFSSRRGNPAEAGTFFLASLLAGGGVQTRNGPPAAGLAQWSLSADVGRLRGVGGRRCRSPWRWTSRCCSGPASRP